MNTQQQLLSAIWQPGECDDAGNVFCQQGVDIYRRNLLANATRSLSISFPTLFQLLDSDVSDLLTHQLLHYSAPIQGDWGQWGAHLPSLIEQSTMIENYPYLADCARLDWAIHLALHGADQMLDKSSLQRLADTELKHLVVEFNQNLLLIDSDFPLDDIFYAHHGEAQLDKDTAMSRAQHALAGDLVRQSYLVFRPEFQPKVTVITQSEAVFMQQLMVGLSLENALDSVGEDSTFSFEQWLINAIERNLITCFKERIS